MGNVGTWVEKPYKGKAHLNLIKKASTVAISIYFCEVI